MIGSTPENGAGREGQVDRVWEVLVNPKAGRRAISVDKIASVLASHGVAHRISLTTSVEDLRRHAVDAALAGSPIALAGGDGTVSTVVDAVLAADTGLRPLIAILPVGTGCDLLRTFGIKPDLETAAGHLSGDAEYVIDVGRIEGAFGVRHFVNVAQAGVGAAAAETAPRLPRQLGPIRYPLAFAARLPRFPRVPIEVTAARPWTGEALAVIFSNAQFFAGGWNVAPKALMVDGQLDVQIFSTAKRNAPALVPKIIKGVHLGDPTVTRRSLDSFDIRTSQPWPVEADGDLIGYTPITVTVVPGAVRLKI